MRRDTLSGLVAALLLAIVRRGGQLYDPLKGIDIKYNILTTYFNVFILLFLGMIIYSHPSRASVKELPRLGNIRRYFFM